MIHLLQKFWNALFGASTKLFFIRLYMRIFSTSIVLIVLPVLIIIFIAVYLSARRNFKNRKSGRKGGTNER